MLKGSLIVLVTDNYTGVNYVIISCTPEYMYSHKYIYSACKKVRLNWYIILSNYIDVMLFYFYFLSGDTGYRIFKNKYV